MVNLCEMGAIERLRHRCDRTQVPFGELEEQFVKDVEQCERWERSEGHRQVYDVLNL